MSAIAEHGKLDNELTLRDPSAEISTFLGGQEDERDR
jgi:hypothetical protein